MVILSGGEAADTGGKCPLAEEADGARVLV